MCVQHASRVIPMSIAYSAGTPSIDEGTAHASVADTATGVATVTFTNAFARTPIIVATGVITSTGDVLIPVLRSVTASGFILEVSDDAGTLTDPTSVHLLIFGFDSADEA